MCPVRGRSSGRRVRLGQQERWGHRSAGRSPTSTYLSSSTDTRLPRCRLDRYIDCFAWQRPTSLVRASEALSRADVSDTQTGGPNPYAHFTFTAAARTRCPTTTGGAGKSGSRRAPARGAGFRWRRWCPMVGRGGKAKRDREGEKMLVGALLAIAARVAGSLLDRLINWWQERCS